VQSCLREECETLGAEMAVHNLADGEVLCREEEVDSALYLLVSGRISVVNQQMGNEVTVYTMNQGETAGTRVFGSRRN
jgi:CRP-like cAMP-binding protein